MPRRLKHWGWGYEDEQLTLDQTRAAAAAIAERLGFGSEEPEQPAPLAAVSLPPSRLKVPSSLAAICATEDYERCLHAYGRSYADIVRAFATSLVRAGVRRFSAPPTSETPYYTVLAPVSRGGERAQWTEIKRAASEAVLDAGGTITHHHAVGRDHRPWYDRQRPDPFARALRAAKAALDPAGMLNPGVLIDPQRSASAE